jgi:hypothetical protein
MSRSPGASIPSYGHPDCSLLSLAWRALSTVSDFDRATAPSALVGSRRRLGSTWLSPEEAGRSHDPVIMRGGLH